MVNQIISLPVTLVLGFAGSGKTSLIKHLSSQSQTTVEHIQSGKQKLSSGCICCSGLNDLKQLINNLLVDRETEKVDTQQLFIEASHETDPIPVIRTIRQHFSPEKIILKEVITVINATKYPPTDAQRYLVTNQIFFADKIVVNYCDQATDDQIDKCYKHIRGIKWQPIFNAIRGIIRFNQLSPVPLVLETSTRI